MKKSTFTFLFLTLLCVGVIVYACATAQTLPPKKNPVAKTDTATKKVKYEYFIKMPSADVNQYLQLLKDYRTLVIYEPGRTADQAVQLQKGIDAYLERFTKSIKLDSAIVKK